MSRARSRKTPSAAAAGALAPYFHAFFEAVDVGACFLDASGRLLAVNEAMRRLLVPREFAVGEPCDALAADVDGLCGRCPAQEVLASGERTSQVVAVPAPDGGERQLEVVCHPLRDASGAIIGLAETVRDVTRRQAVEREMAMVARDIEMLLGSIRSILVSLDGEDRIRRFNASAEAVFGLAAADVTGRDFFDVGIDWEEDCVREAMAESRRTLRPVRVDEVRCFIPGGDERLLGLTVNPVPVPQGPPGVLLLGQDLSEIKARELKALHERRMQAMGQLASGIAHEINTPIQYVSYNAGFLDEAFGEMLTLAAAYGKLADAAAAVAGEGDARAALAASLGRVRELEAETDLPYLRQEVPTAIANTRKGIRQVTEIVGAMRQMSHPGTGEALFFDINAQIRDIVTITRNAWKHVAEVEFDLAPDLPLVYGQPHEVSQVLLNVVLNAAQALEEQAQREPWRRGRIAIASSLVAGSVTVTVADNGPGVDPAHAGRIFDPFFTTKPAGKGTGQGLAISHAIMARHGGTIECGSRPGEGARFFIRFPTEGGAQKA
ncbi:PAS domain-containing protein [Solidesulfovibrio sp.]|uniref:PAS domain-containing sensor histidine kinase n=1 Tax=Solidesulfovibrio sp. TaxID=2910990 RepID=UPI0026101C89|nr:PAS domain-containing protein [Solidesulfovibrio sp.]